MDEVCPSVKVNLEVGSLVAVKYEKKAFVFSILVHERGCMILTFK